MHRVTDGDHYPEHNARARTLSWIHPDLRFSVPLGKAFFLNLADNTPRHLVQTATSRRLHLGTRTPNQVHRRLCIEQALLLLLLLRSNRLIRHRGACLGRSCSAHAISSRQSPLNSNPPRRPVRKAARQSTVVGLANGETCCRPPRIATHSNKNPSLPHRRCRLQKL